MHRGQHERPHGQEHGSRDPGAPPGALDPLAPARRALEQRNHEAGRAGQGHRGHDGRDGVVEQGPMAPPWSPGRDVKIGPAASAIAPASSSR